MTARWRVSSWCLVWRACVLLVCLCGLPAQVFAQSFSLAALQQHLQQAPVVRGQFVQQKILRGADGLVLSSRGHFVLARGHGLLWRVASPIAQDLRITARGMAQRTDAASPWQPLPQQRGREVGLFLAVLAGDTDRLRTHFDLNLTGSAPGWTLTLTPRAAVLRQVFTRIVIAGGAQVADIELVETQGDRTRLQFQQVAPDAALSDAERHAFDG